MIPTVSKFIILEVLSNSIMFADFFPGTKVVKIPSRLLGSKFCIEDSVWKHIGQKVTKLESTGAVSLQTTMEFDWRVEGRKVD
jgi:hypothetical protein